MRRQFSTIALAATLGLALALTFSCSSGDDGGNPGVGPNCSLNGETVNIGGQVWMAKNLNSDVSGSKCYDNDPANCAKYGRLYNWETARTVCPTSWHLPSDAEWDALVTAAGGSSVAGEKLKAASGWYEDGNGTDYYCFGSLPGGYGNSDSEGDLYLGKDGYWWSATDGDDGSNVYIRSIYYYNTDVGRTDGGKTKLFSVRCVQD